MIQSTIEKMAALKRVPIEPSPKRNQRLVNLPKTYFGFHTQILFLLLMIATLIGKLPKSLFQTNSCALVPSQQLEGSFEADPAAVGSTGATLTMSVQL